MGDKNIPGIGISGSPMPHKASILAVLCTVLLLLAQGFATPKRLAAVPVQDTYDRMTQNNPWHP
jgi:hypothetical protein